VDSVQWLHTFTVRFSSGIAYEAAKAKTGWCGYGDFILEGKESADDGYGHPAIIAADTAYCGFFLTN